MQYSFTQSMEIPQATQRYTEKRSPSSKYRYVCDCIGPPDKSSIKGLWYNKHDHSFRIDSPLYYVLSSALSNKVGYNISGEYVNGATMSPDDKTLDNAQRVSYADLARGFIKWGNIEWSFKLPPEFLR